MAQKVKTRPVVVSPELQAAEAQGLKPLRRSVDKGDHVRIEMVTDAATLEAWAKRTLNSDTRPVNDNGSQDAEALSPARRLLLKAGGGKEVKPKPVEILGETLYVRRLDAAAVQSLTLLCDRTETGQLDILSQEGARSYYRAILLTTVTIDPMGTVPFFSLPEAAEWVRDTEPEIRGAVDVMLSAAYEMNPDLFLAPTPKPEEQKAIEEQEKKESGAGSPSTGSAATS